MRTKRYWKVYIIDSDFDSFPQCNWSFRTPKTILIFAIIFTKRNFWLLFYFQLDFLPFENWYWAFNLTNLILLCSAFEYKLNVENNFSKFEANKKSFKITFGMVLNHILKRKKYIFLYFSGDKNSLILFGTSDPFTYSIAEVNQLI